MPEILKNMLKPEIIWALLGMIFIMLEFAVPGLIIFFFGIGALLVSLLCLLSPYINDSLNLQLIIFIVSSVVVLFSRRGTLKKVFSGLVSTKQEMQDNLSEYVGKKAIVAVEIKPGRNGKIELHGTNWDAQCDQEIEEGSTVEIVGRDNITMIVKSI